MVSDCRATCGAGERPPCSQDVPVPVPRGGQLARPRPGAGAASPVGKPGGRLACLVPGPDRPEGEADGHRAGESAPHLPVAQSTGPPAISHQLVPSFRFLPPSIRPAEGPPGQQGDGVQGSASPTWLCPGAYEGSGTPHCRGHSRNTGRYLEDVLDASVNQFHIHGVPQGIRR